MPYITESEREQNAKVLQIRMDNGGEYSSNESIAKLQQAGIKRKTTCPYHPQQNGVSERLNKTLLNKIRSLLLKSSRPHRMWGEVLLTANYLKNRSPTAVLNITPFEMWTGKSLRLNHLKVFGCLAFVQIPKEKQKSKLSCKAEPLVFVGYDENEKSYKLKRLNNDKIVRSHHVTFQERKFPFKNTA